MGKRTALLIGKEKLRKVKIYAATEGYTLQSAIDHIIDKFFHDVDIDLGSESDLSEEIISDFEKYSDTIKPVRDDEVEVDTPSIIMSEETEDEVETTEEIEGTYEDSPDINDLL